MPRTKKIQPPLKPKSRAERPRCLQCHRRLDPQFIVPPFPPRLLDGRRKTERKRWNDEHPPQFTGHYGRYNDDRFCGQACGYNYAVAHTVPAK